MINTCLYWHTCVYVCACMCMHEYMCMCVCVCVCVCLFGRLHVCLCWKASGECQPQLGIQPMILSFPDMYKKLSTIIRPVTWLILPVRCTATLANFMHLWVPTWSTILFEIMDTSVHTTTSPTILILRICYKGSPLSHQKCIYLSIE